MYPPPLRPIGVSTIVKDVRASCIPLTQASCGPDFTGALVLRSNVTLSSATTYFSYYDPRYSDETDFMNKMKAFLSPDIGLPSQLTEASKPSLKSAMARQYQATLFCTAAVFTAYQAGCYDASSAFTVGNGTYAACYGTCKTAVDTLEAAVTDRFGPQPSNVNVSQPFAPWNLVRDMQRACGMMYDHVFPDPFLLNEDSDSSLLTDSDLHCATAVDGALSGAIQEVSTCGFADKSFKDGYCKQYTARWCCQGTNFPRAYYDRDMQFSYYTNEYLSFDVWKSRTTRRETLYTRMQIGFGVFLAVFLIVAITLHVYNIRRVRSDNQQDLSLMDYIALAERSRADAPEREYTMPDTHQPDYTSFFRLMDLNLPEEGGTVLDLDRLFHLESLGWISRDGFMGRTHPAVNPYHPRSDVENRPPLLRLEDLPLATFANKVDSLGSSIPYFKWFKGKNYKLGSTLVAFQNGKMRVYNRFSSTPQLILGASVFVLVLFMISIVIYGVAVAQHDYFFGEPVWLQVITDPIGRFSGIIQQYGVSLIVGLLLLVLYYNSYQQKAQHGLLKYLHQVGAPKVEEVMISYSWEKGVSETAHGVARALTKSGIGCWIDVMKLGVSDDTAQITRTVAAHARFVVIFLTDKYISSPACFIEFLEAVNAPGAKERVIVYLPSRHNVSERVLRLSAQLEKKGILILTDEHELIVCLNDVIIHSNHDSHLYWWQNYVGTVAGIPFDAITPSRTQAGRLKRYTFFGWTPWKAVSISNIWLDSSLRKMGTNGASFPVAGGIGLLSFLLTILMMSVVLRDSMAILSVLLYQTYNVDYGMPRIESPVATNILFVNLALQGLVLILLVFIMSLSDSFDNRYRMHQSLRPLLASFNIRQQLDVDTSSKKKTTNDAFRRMLGTYNALSSLPKIKVLIYDFGTNNQVAKTLHDFLSHLDLTPSELVDFEQDDFGTGLFEVFVPVFVFGSPTGRPLEVASQVTKFGEILRRCGLRMQDCVLIAADPQEKREVVGLFDCTFMLHGREVLMSKFLILVESFYQSHEFASEVIFHIGLRVKGALERITQQSVQNVAARNEQHIESFREQTKPLHQANSASRNYGSYVPLDSA